MLNEDQFVDRIEQKPRRHGGERGNEPRIRRQVACRVHGPVLVLEDLDLAELELGLREDLTVHFDDDLLDDLRLLRRQRAHGEDHGQRSHAGDN
jgi:hypothetical protein